MQNIAEFQKKEKLVLDLIDEKIATISNYNKDTYIDFYKKIFTYNDKDNKYITLFINLGFLIGLDIIDIDTGKSQSEFGFASCFDTLCPCLSLYNWQIHNNKNITTRVKEDVYVKIVSYERKSIDFTTYCNDSSYYETDINTLIDVLFPKGNNIGDICKKEIEELNNAILTDYEKVIEERYKFLLAPILDGIEEYKGVILTDGSNDIIKVKNSDNKDNRTATSYVEEKVKLRKFTNMLCANITAAYNIQTAHNNPHQFDINQIYDNVDSGKVLYFPYKLLELATACKFTTRAQVTYTALTDELSKNKTSFEAYFKYIKPALKKVAAEYLYLVLQHNIIENNKIDTKDTKEIDRLIALKINEEEEGIGPRYLMSTPFWTDYLMRYYTYFIDCITVGFILADYKEITQLGNNSVADFRVKCCGPVSDAPMTTESFINALPSQIVDGGTPVPMGQTTYKSENDASGDVKTNIVSGSTLEYTMQDYAYTPNYIQANALPLFAYKALAQLKEKDASLQLTYDNILLGRDDQNNIIYASKEGGRGRIKFGGHNTHLLIAGSRAGKGVMTYNLIVTAIANNMPIFYMDGKPDTAVALRELNPNVYCVDNAQQTDTMDTKLLFGPKTRGFGTAENGFNTPLVPKYIVANRNINTFGVISYYRGVMLPLAMVTYASKHPEKPFSQKWNNTMKSSGGYLIVLDEISNYINFYTNLFGVRGSISKTVIGPESVTKITKPLSDAVRKNDNAIMKLQSNIRKEQAKSEDKRDNVQIEQWEKEIEDLIAEQAETQTTFPVEDLYWSNFMATVNKNSEYLASKRDAGSILDTIQVICIGQNVEGIIKCVDPSETPEKFTLVKGGKGYLTSEDGHSIPKNGIPWLQLLLTSPLNGGDIIIGYNNDYPNYGGANVDVKMKAHLSVKKQGFAHRELTASKGASAYASKLRDVMNPNTSSGESYKDYTRFRPYLILNDANCPPISLLNEGGCDLTDRNAVSSARAHTKEPGAYVAQCLTRVEEALYGKNGTQEEYADAWEQFKVDNAPDDNDKQGAIINSGLGFEGYITRLGASDSISKLGLSGDLANEFIREVYSYTGTWQEFLDDMRPEYFINLQDIEDGHTVQGLLGDFLLNDTIKRNVVKTYTPESCAVTFGSLSSYYFSATNDVSSTTVAEELVNKTSVMSTQSFSTEENNEFTTVNDITLNMQEIYSIIDSLYNKLQESDTNLSKFIPKTNEYISKLCIEFAPAYNSDSSKNYSNTNELVVQRIINDYQTAFVLNQKTNVATEKENSDTEPIYNVSTDEIIEDIPSDDELINQAKQFVHKFKMDLINKIEYADTIPEAVKFNLFVNMDTIICEALNSHLNTKFTREDIRGLSS